MSDINDPADIAKKVTRLKLERPSRYGFIYSRIEDGIIAIEDLKQRAEERSVLRPDGREEGELLSYLHELDLIDCWNPESHNSRYQIENPEVIGRFVSHMKTHEGLRWDKATVAGSLRAVAETVLEEEESLAAHKMDEIKPVPGTDSIKTHYGSWNNALFHAGIPLNNEEMASGDVIDVYRRRADELERHPERQELEEVSCITDRKIYNIVDSYDELKTELPPKIREEKYLNEGKSALKFEGPLSSQHDYYSVGPGIVLAEDD